MKINNKTTKEQIMAMENLYHTYNLSDCSKKLRDDEDVVLKFVKQCWVHFEACSDRLKRDREFVKRAIQQKAGCFLYADEGLRRDKKFIIELIKISNAEVIFYSYCKIVSDAYEYLKEPAIEFLENELKLDRDIAKIEREIRIIENLEKEEDKND